MAHSIDIFWLAKGYMLCEKKVITVFFSNLTNYPYTSTTDKLQATGANKQQYWLNII